MKRWIPAVLFLSLASTACQSNQETRSKPLQLVEDEFACTPHPERLQGIRARYPTVFYSGTTQHQTQAYEVLTEVPNEYLHWNFDDNGLRIELRQTFDSIRGMTTSTNAGDGWYPSDMWVGQRTGNFDPLLHELGHATEHYVSKAIPEFDQQLEILYNWVLGQSESAYMRSYAKSDSTEMFAEIFDSFYCSQASRDYMHEHMPRTYYFAQRFLVDPAKLDDGMTGVDSVRGAELGVDPDQDGVAGAHDDCPNTPAGTAVSYARDRYGCAVGQAPQS